MLSMCVILNPLPDLPPGGGKEPSNNTTVTRFEQDNV
jgi:hypothetical protein